MELTPMPDFGGAKPVQLCVKLPPANRGLQAESLSDAMRALYREGAFTDVTLICAGREFRAHRAVLAARSEVFKHGLAANDASRSSAGGARLEVRLADIANPEAVKSMLDYLYEQELDATAPAHRNRDIIKDILRLATNFNLPGLKEHATLWLSKDISTHNVVEKLGICDEFGCNVLRERMLEQLTLNKKALSDVANAGAIMRHPALMRALLQHAAAVPEEPQPKKKGAAAAEEEQVVSKRPAAADAEEEGLEPAAAAAREEPVVSRRPAASEAEELGVYMRPVYMRPAAATAEEEEPVVFKRPAAAAAEPVQKAIKKKPAAR